MLSVKIMRWSPFAFAFAVFGLATVASADQVALQAARDNTLYQVAAGDLSNGLGERLFTGFEVLCREHPHGFTCAGLPEMNVLGIQERLEPAFFLELYSLGFLLKRNAYNFVSFAHTKQHVDDCLAACGRAAQRVGLTR